MVRLVLSSIVGFGFLAGGCASPFLASGNDYVARNNLPIAMETFAAGLEKSPGEAKSIDTEGSDNFFGITVDYSPQDLLIDPG